MAKFGKDFRRLKSVEIATKKQTLTFPHGGLPLEIECLVQFKMTYKINVAEEKRLCPLEARLNPEWRCKEWDEVRSECYTFYGHNE
jgi:hypothetical protein